MHVSFPLAPALAGDPAGMLQLLSLMLVFAVLYFLILRPQAKRQRERDAMLKRVQKGDRIVTSGGLYGTVVNVKDDVLVVKIVDNFGRVELARPGVASILGPSGETQEAAS